MSLRISSPDLVRPIHCDAVVQQPTDGGRRASATVALRGCREVDRDPAGAGQRAAVELQPAWRAAARQPAFGDDDVGLGAGARPTSPTRSIATSAWRGSASAGRRARRGDAAVARAGRERARGERLRFVVEACGLGDDLADEVAAPLAQHAAACRRRRPPRGGCPSPVTSRSGVGDRPRPPSPSPIGTRPSKRAQLVHRNSHRPPATIVPNAHGGIAASNATAPRLRRRNAPGRAAASSDRPHSHHKGAPSPAMSSNSAPASSGMMTKVVSGMATMLAKTPYRPARWKW